MKAIKHTIVGIRQSICSLHYLDLAAFALLFVSFFLRFRFLAYPLGIGDVGQHYLVSRHIAFFGETPVTGGWSTAFILTSPLYNYLFVPFILLSDDLLFLSYVNIIIQTISIGLVLLIGTRMFDKKTGLAASLLYAMSYEVFHASKYPLLPHVAQPIIHLAIYMLLRARKHLNITWILSGVVTLAAACAIYISTFALAPLYVLSASYLMRRRSRSFLASTLPGVVFVFSTIIFFSPILFYAFVMHDASIVAPRELTTTAVMHLMQLSSSVRGFYETLLHPAALHPGLAALAGAVVVISVIGSLLLSQHGPRRIYKLLLLSGVLSLIVALSIFRTIVEPHHFAPVYGIFFILVSVSLVDLARTFPWTKIGVIFAYCIVLFATSAHMFYATARPRVENAQYIYHAVAAITHDVDRIRQERNLETYLFFDLYSYEHGVRSFGSSTFWAELEKTTGERLVLIDEQSAINFTPIGDDGVIYVICDRYMHRQDDVNAMCLDIFRNGNPDYVLTRDVYEGPVFTVVRAQQTSEFSEELH